MIGYVTIGANDLDAAIRFYDALFATLGGKRTFASGDRMQFYGSDSNPGVVAINRPLDGKPANAGNGCMFGFPATSKAQVDAAHAAALAAGGTDEGAPSQHQTAFYAGYFRDLDGHKVCVFKMG
jgi:catechol 2,3-dioxygenase-like lactoylglutathione lyase family enzyme